MQNMTQAIFNISVLGHCGTRAAKQYGVSEETLEQLNNGGALEGYDSESDLVSNAVACAEYFAVKARDVIEKLTDRDAELFASDIAALTEMLGWTYNEAELIQLARAEWKETYSETV